VRSVVGGGVFVFRELLEGLRPEGSVGVVVWD